MSADGERPQSSAACRLCHSERVPHVSVRVHLLTFLTSLSPLNRDEGASQMYLKSPLTLSR